MVATGYDEGNYDDDLHGYDDNNNYEYQSAASSNCEVIDILNSSKFCRVTNVQGVRIYYADLWFRHSEF